MSIEVAARIFLFLPQQSTFSSSAVHRAYQIPGQATTDPGTEIHQK